MPHFNGFLSSSGYFTHGSLSRLRPEANAQLRWLDVRSVVFMFESLAAVPIAIGTANGPEGRSERSIFLPPHGVGRDEGIKSLEIRWPSGFIQTLKNFRGARIMQIDNPVANESPGTNKNMIGQ